MSPTEQGDLAAAKHGDLDAMERLVEKYYRRVRAVVAFVGLRKPEDIEDAVQETFIRSFENLSSMRGNRFRSWVYGIARNVAYESLREKKLPAAGDMVEDLAHQTEGASMPEEWLSALDHCVERLPEESRKLLRQIYGAGLKMQEAAEVVGKSVGAVKVSVFRLREALRKCIEGYLGGAPWTAAEKK